MRLYNGVVSTLAALAIPDFRQWDNGHYDWIQFGIDNSLPQYIADLVTLSPTHEAIIEAKRTFLNGNLKIDTKSSTLDLDDINGLGDSLEEFIDATNADIANYESFYWEVVYNRQHTRILKVNHIPYEHVRVGKYNEDGRIDTVYVSPDWGRKYLKRNAPKPMAVYNPSNIDTDSQVMIMRIKRPNQPYYTVPSFMSAIQFILLEDDIASLNRNDVTNGFFPSMIMNFFNGEPDEDDKAEMEAYINSKFKGASGSKLMMFFGNDPEKKVQMDTFVPPNLGEYSDRMIPIIEKKILSAHRANPNLAGITSSTGLSNAADEIQTAFELYLRGVIVPLQKLIINALKKIYKFNGDEADIMFENELLTSKNASQEELDDAANAEVNDKAAVEKKNNTNDIKPEEDGK